jgi:hypothetical protein
MPSEEEEEEATPGGKAATPHGQRRLPQLAVSEPSVNILGNRVGLKGFTSLDLFVGVSTNLN